MIAVTGSTEEIRSLLFNDRYDDHVQKYRWNKIANRDVSSDELLRAAGLILQQQQQKQTS